MSEWQPIETAPKDGTHILGESCGAMTVVRPVFDHEDEFVYWGLAFAGSFAEDDEWNPTHWMPLPDPPKMTIYSGFDYGYKQDPEEKS